MKFFLTLLALAVPFALAGCRPKTTVTGGTTRHEDGGFSVTYDAPQGGRITIADNRSTDATTRPSFATTSDKANIKGQGDDEIGGFSLSAVDFKKTPTQWGLIIALAVLCAASAYLRYYAAAVLFGAGLILGFLAPTLLIWIAVGAVVVVAFLFIKKHNEANKIVTQLVAGNQNAVNILPPIQAERVKAEWDKSQDASVKEKVKDVKAELPAAALRTSPQAAP